MWRILIHFKMLEEIIPNTWEGVTFDVIPSYECAGVDVKVKTKTFTFDIVKTAEASIDR